MIAALILLLVVALPVAADEVHLTNGETFEGVIAEVQGDHVAIHLPHGMIRLPMTRVVRIDRSVSAYEEFLARAEALAGSTSAQEWLTLALWARDHDLRSGERDAALEAARLDPDLEGLAPVMRDLGFARDDQLGGWIPYDELMTRKGYVQVDGRWVSAEIVAEAARQAREEHERQVADRRADQVDRAITLLALAQLQQSQNETERQSTPAVVYPYGAPVGAPVAVFPGSYVLRGRQAGGHRGPGDGHPDGGGQPPQVAHPRSPAHNTVTWDDVAHHQPGSIIPIQPRVSSSSHPKN